MHPTGSPFESARSSAHASADGASFIGHENMSPQPVVKLSGSWRKMAYRVPRSLPHRPIFEREGFFKKKKAFRSAWTHQMLLTAENCGRFVHLAPVLKRP